MKKLLYFLMAFFLAFYAYADDTDVPGMNPDATPVCGSYLYTIFDPNGASEDDRFSTVCQTLGASADIETDGTLKWENADALDASGDLVADIVDSAEIADDAVNSEHYTDGSVDLAHMSAESVDSDQYVDGSIDLAHMSAESVDSDQYVDGSIDLAHMSVESIDSDQYVDGSIDYAHLAAAIYAAMAGDVVLTNITQITNKAWTDLTGTNWRLTATNGSGVPTEVEFGGDGTFLMSNGAAVAPTFEAAPGGGTMTTVAGVASDGATEVGDTDIVKLDFSAGAYSMSESPATEINIGARRHKCVVITDVSAADTNIMMGSLPVAITVIKGWCRYQGTGTTPAQIEIEDATGNEFEAAGSDVSMTCVEYTVAPEEDAGLETYAAANTLIAYEAMQFDVTNTPDPTNDTYEICVEYIID